MGDCVINGEQVGRTGVPRVLCCPLDHIITPAKLHNAPLKMISLIGQAIEVEFLNGCQPFVCYNFRLERVAPSSLALPYNFPWCERVVNQLVGLIICGSVVEISTGSIHYISHPRSRQASSNRYPMTVVWKICVYARRFGESHLARKEASETDVKWIE